jgi:DNA-binding IclR family transcriptional regulator
MSSYNAMRGKWIDYINQNPNIDDGAARLAVFIANRTGAENPVCWFELKTVCERFGWSRSKAFRASTLLLNEGLIEKERTFNSANRYRLRFDFTV